MKHVAIYMRVSGAAGQTTESQRGDLERWVAAYCPNDLVVWYEDTSNDHTEMNREAWNRLHGEIQAGNVSKLVVWKLDRLGRGARKLMDLFEQFRLLGVQFISLKESLDLSTPLGVLMANILASVAQWELENISMRIKAGKRRRRERGLKQSGRKGIRIKLTEEKLATIRALHKIGCTSKRIAEDTRLSASYVRVLIRQEFPDGVENKVPLKDRPTRRKAKHYKLEAADIRVLKNMVVQDMSVTAMSQTLKISRQHVYRAIKMYCGQDKCIRRTPVERAIERDEELAAIPCEDWGVNLEELVR